MAIFHLSVKPLARRAGRSAIAAAAYRAGVRLVDQRTGISHDYRRRGGVVFTQILMPVKYQNFRDRESIWNEAEKIEVRSDARTAREIEISLPAELSPIQRKQLAQEFANELVLKHQVVADLAIHSPTKGDVRNHHAHILITTRQINSDGLCNKTREFDDRKEGPLLIQYWRERWAHLVNGYLERAGRLERVDHRSLRDQGNGSKAQHLPLGAIQLERRTGNRSWRRDEREQIVIELNKADSQIQMTRKAARAARNELKDELSKVYFPNLSDALQKNRSAITQANSMNTPPPTDADYELAESIKRRQSHDPQVHPTKQELNAINRIIVQQARDRLLIEDALTKNRSASSPIKSKTSQNGSSHDYYP